MVKLNSQKLSSKGDTIVEVLIAIAIVSVVLAGAFAATRRSANATRTAQEQGEALKLAESQVELIKGAASSGNPNVISTNDFCIIAATASLSPTNNCVTNNGIDYTTVVTHVAGTKDFVTKVTWDGLSGVTNSVELDYRAQ